MFEDRKQVLVCPVCEAEFKKVNNKKYCSKKCAAKITRNRLGTKKGVRKHKSVGQYRLQQLKDAFHFTSCMVIGCDYNRTYDVHRLIEGSNGGKYEIGNMFAICPKHHAEVHRKIIALEKIDDCNLKEIDLIEKRDGS